MIKNKLIIIIFISPVLLYGQNTETNNLGLDIGRFHISNIPRFIEGGLQYDFLFGIFYTEQKKIAGDLKIRSVFESEGNVKLWSIDDSMLSRDKQSYEIFLLPFNYYFFSSNTLKIHAGAGLYYNYSKLNENGYFNDSSFRESATEAVYNSYTNNFIAHALGPLLDIGISYRNGIFYGAFSIGTVPVHYLNRSQSWNLSPFMNPVSSYSVNSESIFGPYFYFNLDLAIRFSYFSIFTSLLGEYSRLHYTAAGINSETGTWTDVETEIENKIYAFEISLLIHLGISDIRMQVGYGRKFDEAAGDKNYLLLGAKKEWF